MEAKELPALETKQINGVNVTNLEIAKIAMVCDYLVLDRFQDLSSFLRFEKCFGPLFSNEKPNFLFTVYQEICGHKKKYITFGRLISAYLIWKSHLSKNDDFNKFMSVLFNKMIKTNNEVVGTPVEKGKVFSTRNARGRKVISKFSVLSDIKKNAIKGFHIQYDDVFDSYLRPKNHNEKEVDTSDIKLEINFDTTKVYEMSEMFSGVTNLRELDLSYNSIDNLEVFARPCFKCLTSLNLNNNKI